MVYAAAVLAALCFMLAVRAMAIPAITARVVSTGREAARVIGDRAMRDDDKERRLQAASLVMLRTFGAITGRTAVAVAAAMIPLAGLHAAGLVDVGSVGHVLASWPGIALSATTMTAVCFVKMSP